MMRINKIFKLTIQATLFVILLFSIVGCSSNSSKSSKQIDFSEYKMPENYVPVSYEIESHDGFEMESVEIMNEDSGNWSGMEEWQAWRNKIEQADKYKMVRKVWDAENLNDFVNNEEDRIKEYCKRVGLGKCAGTDRTCEENGCHKVTVECDDDNYDPEIDRYDECRKFKVTVKKAIDENLTKDSRLDITSPFCQ